MQQRPEVDTQRLDNPDLNAPVEIDEDAMQLIRSLGDLGEQEHATVLEADFTRVILPILAGETRDGNLSIWQQYAGHVGRPMRVINQQGERLFDCPPPMAFTPTRVHTKGEESILGVLYEAKQIGDRMPGLGVKFLEEKLPDFIQYDNTLLGRVKRWNAILMRYGREPLGGKTLLPDEPQTNVTETKPAANTSEVSMFSDEDEDS